MSNLGGYQIMTTLAKKVGGPKQLLALTLSGGYVGFRCLEHGVKKGINCIKGIKNGNDQLSTMLYEITSNVITVDGIVLKAGDKFRVLNEMDDAILVEFIGVNDNPYVVSRKWLSSISAFC